MINYTTTILRPFFWDHGWAGARRVS